MYRVNCTETADESNSRSIQTNSLRKSKYSEECTQRLEDTRNKTTMGAKVFQGSKIIATWRGKS